MGAMSPRSRGRPPGRGRRRQPERRPAGNRAAPLPRPRIEPGLTAEETTDCWFDEPPPGDRQSWAIPRGHGTYRGLDLELLNPADEDELTFLIEAIHPELADALRSGDEMIASGEPFSPRLHIAMHQIVANQMLADDPPETWHTVQRLAALGYDWHNIMHMIAAVVSDDVYHALKEDQPFDPGDYIRRLRQLPGDWPQP
jgi:Domain of unknown function (DUF1841)